METKQRRVIRVKMPRKHAKQREVMKAYLAPEVRYIIARWGRRSGKTKWASEVAFGEALQGKAVLWLAPEHKHAKEAWRNMKVLGRQLPQWALDFNEAEKTMQAISGGRVQILSVKDPNSVRSVGVHLAVLDEVAYMRHWDEVWQAVRPALSDFRGKAIFISTPQGKNHFYDLWMGHRDAPDWFLSHMPSWENPFLPKGEIEEARRELPDLFFRQEYGAEFVDVAGAFFKRAWLRTAEVAPPEKEVTALARGWDIAITPDGGDWTAGVKVGVDKDGRVWVLDVARGRWDWPTVVERIRETALRDGAQVSQGIETVGTQKGVWQTLRREPGLAGVPLFPVTPRGDKLTRALPLLSKAKAGQLVLLKRVWTDELVGEMLGFPLGEHDDQVDALGLALQVATEHLGRVEIGPEIWD